MARSKASFPEDPKAIEAIHDPEKKQCSTCLQCLPLTSFYSKGNRIDTCCKACSKARKRSTYVPKNQKYNTERIKLAFDVLIEFEMNELEVLNTRIKETIKKCQK